jgi:hypothetical protein
VQSEPPGNEGEERERDRRRLERVLPELIKRVLDVGYGKISEGPENVRNFVSELKLPKEVLNLLVSQIEETKNGLYRAVARELRDFLESTNLSEEMSKVLSSVALEIRTEVRFRPNPSGERPEVDSQVSVKRATNGNSTGPDGQTADEAP